METSWSQESLLSHLYFFHHGELFSSDRDDPINSNDYMGTSLYWVWSLDSLSYIWCPMLLNHTPTTSLISHFHSSSHLFSFWIHDMVLFSGFFFHCNPILISFIAKFFIVVSPTFFHKWWSLGTACIILWFLQIFRVKPYHIYRVRHIIYHWQTWDNTNFIILCSCCRWWTSLIKLTISVFYVLPEGEKTLFWGQHNSCILPLAN